MTSITVEYLRHKFCNRNGEETEAIRDISFSIETGELVSIVGPSGCGKTTLLKLLGGLLAPQTGKIALDGATPNEARAGGQIGFMFQDDVLLSWRNVEQNIALPLELAYLT